MKWARSTAGPNLLVAHRCTEHRHVAPINNAGMSLVIYPHEGQATARALGAGPEGQEIKAECGGCLADQVEELYQLTLDLLDLFADSLTSRAELRVELDRHKRFLV